MFSSHELKVQEKIYPGCMCDVCYAMWADSFWPFVFLSECPSTVLGINQTLRKLDQHKCCIYNTACIKHTNTIKRVEQQLEQIQATQDKATETEAKNELANLKTKITDKLSQMRFLLKQKSQKKLGKTAYMNQHHQMFPEDGPLAKQAPSPTVQPNIQNTSPPIQEQQAKTSMIYKAAEQTALN